jgi:hypothetical protein
MLLAGRNILRKIMDEEFIPGKKVFFLYPHSVIREELINEIIYNEYEVYFLKDHEDAKRLFRKFPNSIVFINIDEGMTEPEWENYIRGLISHPETADLKVGILSYNPDEELKEKYLLEVGVHCGVIKLKLGLTESAKIILKVLEVNEARGRRKYVRARVDHDPKATFNIRYEDEMVKGQILDISSVGIACKFDTPRVIEKNTILSDIQLQLRGKIVKVSGIFIGVREDNPAVHVIVFSPNQDLAYKMQIHHFIHQSLQSSITKL